MADELTVELVVADWVGPTFGGVATQLMHAVLPDQWGWLTAWRHDTGEVVVVATGRRPSVGWETVVWGGPLHGELEITQSIAYGRRAADCHAKWVWRVAHGEKTRPEYFRKR